MLDNELLLGVRKPARYIGGEWNVSKKSYEDAAITFALCFPDLYEVGASNLGLEILYHAVNKNDGSVAERSYLPAPDMEEAMRSRGIPLFSLESRKPLKDFDMVGVTLQYELCAANVLNLLDLAQIPLFSIRLFALYPPIRCGGSPYPCRKRLLR